MKLSLRNIAIREEVKYTDEMFKTYIVLRDDDCIICGGNVDKHGNIFYIKNKLNLNVRYNEHYAGAICETCNMFLEELLETLDKIKVLKNKHLRPKDKDPDYLDINDVNMAFFTDKRVGLRKKLIDLAYYNIYTKDVRLKDIERYYSKKCKK